MVGVQSLALLRHARLQPSFEEGRLSGGTRFRQDHLKTRERNGVLLTVEKIFLVWLFLEQKKNKSWDVTSSPQSRRSAPHGTAWGRRCQRAGPELRQTWLEKRSSHRSHRSKSSHSLLTGTCSTFIFKLTSFTANVLRKLIEPSERKNPLWEEVLLRLDERSTAEHSAASFDSLNKLACKGLELPGGCRSSQQQIQALSGQHVSQHPQKALGGLGVVRVYCLMKERKCFTSCQHAIWKLSSPFRLLITGTRARQ